jgi:2-oxoglutarate ferredoxin oxidoreductase subunit beta
VAIIGENGVTIDDILVHDETDDDATLHMALINMKLPDMPVAFGVIRSVTAPVYDTEMVAQINHIQQNRKIKNVDELLNSGNIWEVTGNKAWKDPNCPKTRH